jgi:4'-phosphopantetheinyl transferase EntD
MQTGAMPTSEPAPDDTSALDVLFPATVKTVFSPRVSATARLLPAERQATSRFAAVRLEEFRHGRDCAHRALRRLGCGLAEIPVGAHREPLWPGGVTGSISHAGAAAAAAVAWQHDALSLGVDIEPDAPLDEDLAARICRPEEIEREHGARGGSANFARLLFSTKEAAYKALWPVTREFLEFHDLEVRIDHERARFTVISHTPRCPADLARRLEGRFARAHGLLATGVILPVTPTSGC